MIFEKVYDPFRMEEETVRTLCSKKFYIYLVNSDDMKVKEEILVDLSCLVSDRREFPDVKSIQLIIVSLCMRIVG